MLIARGQFTLYETTDGYSARVDPPVWQVLCDPAGTPQTGELGSGGRATFTVSASRGDRPLQMVCTSQPAVEGKCHWRVLSAAGCAHAYQGQDGFCLTAVSADQAAVALTFDFEGRETQTRTLQVTKQRRGADGADGQSALQMVIEGQTLLPATGGTTTLKARLWQDGVEVDAAGTLFQYDWEIYVDDALYATKSGKTTQWMPGPTTWQLGEIRCTAREKA